MNLTHRWALSGLLLVAGCGDGPDASTCIPMPAHEPVDGPFATPESLLYPSCTPGALAGLDVGGSWFFEQDNRKIFSGAGPIQVTNTCEDGFSLRMGSSISTEEVKDSFVSDDYLFWRRERRFDDFDLTIVEAYVICAVTGDGTYVGRHVRCNIDDAQGEQCDSTGLALRRFERLPGEDEAQGLELLSEYRGPSDNWDGDFAANVRVHQGLAYVALDEGGLRIVDVADPTAPVELGVFPSRDAEGYNDVKIVVAGGKTYALMASNQRGMVVIDVSDPSNPRDIVAVTPSGDPAEGIHTLFTEEVGGKTMAYLADGVSNVVSIWDVSNPAVPVRAGQVVSENEDWAVHDLFADQGRLYLNATVGGMLVVDTQPDPASPVAVGQFAPPRVSYSHSNWVTEAGGRKISLHGDEGYDAKFKVVDVDPNSPDFMREIGRYQTRPQVSAHNVMAFGERGYAAYYQDGIRVLDLSDPTAPTLAAYFNTWNPQASPGGRFEGAVGLDVDPVNGLIYVADYPRGLMILKER